MHRTNVHECMHQKTILILYETPYFKFYFHKMGFNAHIFKSCGSHNIQSNNKLICMRPLNRHTEPAY
jgi:hypothetical protein